MVVAVVIAAIVYRCVLRLAWVGVGLAGFAAPGRLAPGLGRGSGGYGPNREVRAVWSRAGPRSLRHEGCK